MASESVDAAAGSVRGLQRLCDNAGTAGVVAIDHGLSLVQRVLFERDPTPTEVQAERARIVRLVSPAATGVVCDLGTGVADAVLNRLVPRDVALVAGLPDLLPSWEHDQPLPWPHDAVQRARSAGCDALKVCLVVASARRDAARVSLAERLAAECRAAGLTLILEIVRSESSDSRSGRLVSASRSDGTSSLASDYATVSADLLKLRVPLPAGATSDRDLLDACKRISDGARSPWVALSAGTTFEVFRHQLEIACRGGASGFVAGTAIWQEALEIVDPAARDEFLSNVAVTRVRTLRDVCAAYATPVWSRGQR